jgi:hypothetical protein
MKIAIDGSGAGSYRADCECGTTWSGRTHLDQCGIASPALPVAEAVVHMKMCHDDTALQLCFTWRFEEWLKRYWDRSSNSEGLVKAQIER